MNKSLSTKRIFENLLISFVEACILWPLIIIALLKNSNYSSIDILWYVLYVVIGLAFPLYPLIECIRCLCYDSKTSLKYNQQTKEISYCRQSVSEIFHIDEIKSCSLIAATSHAVMCYYLEIRLDSEKILCLTSLLKDVPNIAKDTNPTFYREFFLRLPK